MTEEDEGNFKASIECHICNEKYKKDYKDKVRDHDLHTGKYMGSAHKECNTKFYYERKLNVFFHNLRGYDSHFLIQEIGKFNMPMTVLPNNSEKFLNFSIGNVVFKNSLQFMSHSIENLTKNLVQKEKNEKNENNVLNIYQINLKIKNYNYLRKEEYFLMII